MGRSQKKSSKRKADIEEEKPDLDRFVGSSEEEQSSSDDGSDVEETLTTEKLEDDDSQTSNEDETPEGKKQKEAAPVDDSEDSDDDEKDLEASGMANAMSRILGTSAKPGTASVILSKTTTPLQRMAQKEKQLVKEQREKRRANRERNLAALHVPLTVATTVQSSESGGVAKELELERAHRRVATRGVVALFNAIAQHQKKAEAQESTASTSSSKQEVKKLSKHGFLDMIKTTAATKTVKEEKIEPAQQKSSTKPASKWSALQDDYMLNSKLKDWDKESSDEEEEVGETAEDGNWSEEESSPAKPETKKRRIGAR